MMSVYTIGVGVTAAVAVALSGLTGGRGLVLVPGVLPPECPGLTDVRDFGREIM